MSSYNFIWAVELNLYLAQYWLCAQESRIHDNHILKKIDVVVAKAILKKNTWPTDFDHYDDLLAIGVDRGNIARYPDPINSKSLRWTMIDIAKVKPGIRLLYLAENMYLDIETAAAIAQLALAEENIVI